MTLKEELNQYAQDIMGDYDKEEIDNFVEMVNECSNDDMSDMSALSQKLILRLIDDKELYKKVQDAKEEPKIDFSDPFE